MAYSRATQGGRTDHEKGGSGRHRRLKGRSGALYDSAPDMTPVRAFP